MREITLDEIKGTESFDYPIVHSTGVLLIPANMEINDEVFGFLEESELKDLILLEAGDDADKLRVTMQFNQVPVEEIKDRSILAGDICDQNHKLLLKAGTAVPRRFSESLHNRGIELVNVRKAIPWDSIKKLQQCLAELIGDDKTIRLQHFSKRIKDIKVPQAQHFDPKIIWTHSQEAPSAIPTQEKSFQKLLRPTNKAISEANKEVLTQALTQCVESLSSIHDYLKNPSASTLNPQSISETLEEIVASITAVVICHKDLASYCSSHLDSGEVLAEQAIATAVHSILIGAKMDYDEAAIKSLCYGALVADLGMVLLPNNILLKTTPLRDDELKKLHQHPLECLKILESLNNVPEAVPWIVLQSHERVTGEGYPLGENFQGISEFAEIVAVADTFAALISERSFRKKALEQSVMDTMLNYAKESILSRNLVRALLEVQSYYPVGSFVILNDRRIARVVSSEQEKVRRPQLAVITAADGNSTERQFRICLSRRNDLKVIKLLPAHLFNRAGAYIGF